MTGSYKLTTPPVDDASADAETSALFEAARDALGFVPNTYRGMARAPALLETYRLGYGLVRAGSFTGPEQEVIFLTVSLMNDCGYCIGAHSALGIEDFGLAAEHVRALVDDEALSDARLEALRAFTVEMVRSVGQPDADVAEAFLSAGYSEAQMFEVILAISLKMLSNFAGRLGNPEPDERFKPYLPEI